MLNILLIKLIIAIGVVVTLSIVTEKVSPMIAGILAGYPTGSAISLFFFGLEQGKVYAANSAVYNMVGLFAQLMFFYFYYLSSSVIKKLTLVWASFFGFMGYFAIIWILHLVSFSKIVSMIIPFVSMILFIYLFRDIKNTKIQKKIKLDFFVIFIRGVFAATIILSVIGMANFVGPKWAGLFSAFPTTTFPLMLIVQISYGTKHVHSIIKISLME
ncbi:hypothetical protein HN827_04395 [archaeon]|nr:hypothetical protein [archaeon]MBT7392044.1 hypothetical protein [archaeon]